LANTTADAAAHKVSQVTRALYYWTICMIESLTFVYHL